MLCQIFDYVRAVKKEVRRKCKVWLRDNAEGNCLQIEFEQEEEDELFIPSSSVKRNPLPIFAQCEQVASGSKTLADFLKILGAGRQPTTKEALVFYDLKPEVAINFKQIGTAEGKIVIKIELEPYAVGSVKPGLEFVRVT